MDINDILNEFPEDTRRLFREFLKNNLYDYEWCLRKKIKYSDPDMELAKEKSYEDFVRLFHFNQTSASG